MLCIYMNTSVYFSINNFTVFHLIEFTLEVLLEIESAGTTIVILLDSNIPALHRRRLDYGEFVDCRSWDL